MRLSLLYRPPNPLRGMGDLVFIGTYGGMTRKLTRMTWRYAPAGVTSISRFSIAWNSGLFSMGSYSGM